MLSSYTPYFNSFLLKTKIWNRGFTLMDADFLKLRTSLIRPEFGLFKNLIYCRILRHPGGIFNMVTFY